MKTTLNSLLITAAGFALSAAAAYGQNLTANVPFEFHTAGGVQPAGEYLVSPATYDGSVAQFQNRQTGHSVMTGIGSPNGNPNDKKPQLVFRCGSESGCALVAVKMGDGRGWSYKAPKLKASETERVAVIYMGSNQAE